MKEKLLGVAATLMCLALAPPAYAGSYNYTAIDVPGALPGNTDPYGINDASQIAGTYYDGSYHGFLLSGGTYTTLNVPGAVATYANGINDAGRIVVYYSNGVGNHGFLYSGGVYTTLDAPSINGNTHAQGINNSGQIVGYYNGGAFLYSGGSYTNLVPPLTCCNVATGINAPGQIVGFGGTGGADSGFLKNGGSYATIDVPSALNTVPWGINNKGQIVGYYNSGLAVPGDTNGFLYSGGVYTTIDDPLATLNTEAYGINDRGQIVGWYDNGHGFLATPISPTPLPAALPLFATGLGALGLLGWRRKRNATAVAA